jgi:nitrogen fixation protein NifB
MNTMDRHPCFDAEARHRYGRIHLPVAPRCNIQCRFCNRKYDCINESRPGVTSTVLSPAEALRWLNTACSKRSDLTVVGIAGPGDPFATPELTLETMRLVKQYYPEMLLCLASNGMNVAPYVDEIAAIGVSHVTITVNAVDPEIGKNIYRWMRQGTSVLRDAEGAAALLENQMKAIRLLKEKDITVKVNTIIIPGVNDHHIEEIAKTVAAMGVDIQNCMALYPAEGSDFEDHQAPDDAMVAAVRLLAGTHLKQMSHCARCRADAIGLIGEADDAAVMASMQAHHAGPGTPDGVRRYIAVASEEGLLVNQHLGAALDFRIYDYNGRSAVLIEKRDAPLPGSGDSRWQQLAEVLRDCHSVLVSQAGMMPREVLEKAGIAVITMEGLIETAVASLARGSGVPAYMTVSGTCKGGGGGGGCGA